MSESGMINSGFAINDVVWNLHETTLHPNKTDVAESTLYSYNDSNQLVSAKLFDGKKNTTVTYAYDVNGNLISEIGAYGTDQVETYYDYTVENRLQAVYEKDRLLMAAAYDGDGNRVFQLNYNLHTDEDWKDNSGNGNGNNKDNAESGNNGNGKGNTTNAGEYNSQNQSGILFPVAEEISQTETDLIAMIETTGKEKDYELIEYVLDINTRYTQVLMELNENGAMDAAYTYGVSRLTEDRFTGESNFYLYDPTGNVTGITDQNGYLWQSYRYDAFGNATFGSPQYDNEYTFNAESYNPNIHSQYLRARYYDTVKGSFLTEDSYLGDIRNPLTLNRYNYCIGNPLFCSDPSGHYPTQKELQEIYNYVDDKYPIDSNMSREEQIKMYSTRRKETNKFVKHLSALQYLGMNYASVTFVTEYDYSNTEELNTFDNMLGEAASKGMKNNCYQPEKGSKVRTEDGWLDLYNAPTVEGKGRPVSIPDDRPRSRSELKDRYGANTAPSWKSYEAVYGEEHNYLGEDADRVVREKDPRLVRRADDYGMIRTEIDGIDRYWVAVGPKVMDESYSITGRRPQAEDVKVGTFIDVILRDSNYNIYFVPAIVGDAKEHTYPNGIYQTGTSWNTLDSSYAKKSDAAIIEFIREPPVPDGDTLINTPEFDILGIIVYDEV